MTIKRNKKDQASNSNNNFNLSHVGRRLTCPDRLPAGSPHVHLVNMTLVKSSTFQHYPKEKES